MRIETIVPNHVYKRMLELRRKYPKRPEWRIIVKAIKEDRDKAEYDLGAIAKQAILEMARKVFPNKPEELFVVPRFSASIRIRRGKCRVKKEMSHDACGND